jgi:hypothetical protein
LLFRRVLVNQLIHDLTLLVAVSSVTNNLQKREGDMTSANLLVVLLVGAIVGALAGLGLGGLISNPLYLGIAAGFLATIVAGLVRNFLVNKGALGPKYSALPGVVILYAVIASIAGSAGAVEIDQAAGLTSPVWIGTLAGLFSGILMALLMITYYMHPGQSRI